MNGRYGLVSVIIPTYNREKLILRSVKSVLEQTYSDIELIVVDDCSTDKTKVVLEKVSDPRFRYIQMEKNGGACAARNKGIEEAKGDFIAFQDSDDEWEREKIEKQLLRLKESDADFCFCKMRVIDTVTKEKKVIPDKTTENDLTFTRLLIGNFISTQMLLIKRKCFDEIRFDVSLPRYQDWDLSISLYKKYKAVFEPTPLVNQYIQSDSISKSNVKLAVATEKIYRKHEEDFKKEHDAHVKILRDISRNFAKNGLDAMPYYKKLFRTEKSFSSVAKILLYKVGLLQKFYNAKK